MFVLLTVVLVGASVVSPVCGQCKSCNNDTTICIPKDGEDDCVDCRDYYVLIERGNITCHANCPDGTYEEGPSPYKCWKCSVIHKHCVKCHKVSTTAKCTECEHGYVVVAGKCEKSLMTTPSPSSADSPGVCPLYTCMLPVVGGGVALVLVVVCMWVVCRRRSRQSTRPPPGRGDIGVMTTDPEAGRTRGVTSGFDPPTQTTGFDPPTQTTWETGTPTQRHYQREVNTAGSTSTENSRHKKKKKSKQSYNHRGRRHHSNSSEAKVRTRDRDKDRPRTEQHTGRREGDNNRVSIVSEATRIYHELKKRGRGREDLPPVPMEGGKEYENEDVIGQLHKAGPMTSPGSGDRRHDTADAKPSSSRGRPADRTQGDPEPHEYVNEDVIKTLQKSKSNAGEGPRLDGISARGATASGSAAAASDSVVDPTVGRPPNHPADEEQRDYVNAEVIETLQNKGPHDYENKDAIEQLKKEKEKKHDYVNVDPSKPNPGKR